MKNVKIVCSQCHIILNQKNRSNNLKIVNAHTKTSICIDCDNSNFQKYATLPIELQRIIFEYADYEMQYIKLSSRILKLNRFISSLKPQMIHLSKQQLIDFAIYKINFHTPFHLKVDKRTSTESLLKRIAFSTSGDLRLRGATHYIKQYISYADNEHLPLSTHFFTYKLMEINQAELRLSDEHKQHLLRILISPDGKQEVEYGGGYNILYMRKLLSLLREIILSNYNHR